MKKILILNRRDIKNPLSGGAEIYTHEIFKRLTGGFDITHFSSGFDSAEKEQVIDNIRYIRRGNELTTHLWGFLYAVRYKKYYDLIIDQFNGVGFMTFGFKKSMMLVHQLYGDFWTAKFAKTGNFFKFLERMLLWLYRHKTVVTVSDSTKQDLLGLGYTAAQIHMVLNGINYIKYSVKESFDPVVMYLGRLAKTKNPEDAIKAFLTAKDKLESLGMYIAGEGEERSRLEGIYRGHPEIKFLGFVTEEEKYKLLREASVLLVPSIREGWGQVVIQANMVGTPVIGYDVQGIRDSVVDGETGILVKKGNVSEFADGIVYLFKDSNALRKLSDNALQYAEKFLWDNSAEKMKTILTEI